jgi:hypothetical protein
MKLIGKNTIIILGIIVAMLILSDNSISKNRVAVTAETKVTENVSESVESKTLNASLSSFESIIEDDGSTPSQPSDINLQVLTSDFTGV